MRSILFLLLADCLGDFQPLPPRSQPDLSSIQWQQATIPDLAHADLAEAPVEPRDLASSVSHDLAPTPADMATGSSQLKALCQVCSRDAECASGLCAEYMMGTVKKCSHTCAAATAATDCPGVNACNGMNVCKCQ